MTPPHSRKITELHAIFNVRELARLCLVSMPMEAWTSDVNCG